MKKSTDTIGNRTRDLLVCSAVPQPTAPPRKPPWQPQILYIYRVICMRHAKLQGVTIRVIFSKNAILTYARLKTLISLRAFKYTYMALAENVTICIFFHTVQV
jgi:hypothetical protein